MTDQNQLTPEEEKVGETVNVKQDAKGLVKSIATFLSELLDIRGETDKEQTIASIKGDIPFKGHTAWILICSIFVASVGLNANSTAVVIGAMLISPLMGPILGIGLSVAINDIDTIRKALVNFGVMILLSVLTAFLFFKFFPLQEESSELLARTKPDIRDVLIAFFGGAALIIARTKKGTIASVIFGVAIATALMPPLCTVGYGLSVATGEDFTKGIEYAGGAMYLFTINTIFIALATFLVLKILRFPMRKYANSQRRKRISQIATLLAIVAMIPAVMTFVSVLRESNFRNDAKKFIAKELNGLPNANYIKKYATIVYNPDETSAIELTTFGTDEIDESTRAVLEQRFKDYSSLNGVKLIVNQAKKRVVNNLEYMEELRSRDSLDLMTQRQKITFLEAKVQELSRLERTQIPFEALAKEVKINYEAIGQLSYSSLITSDFKKIDTLAVFEAKWIDSLSDDKSIAKDKIKLAQWLKLKLKLDTLLVKQVD